MELGNVSKAVQLGRQTSQVVARSDFTVKLLIHSVFPMNGATLKLFAMSYRGIVAIKSRLPVRGGVLYGKITDDKHKVLE